MNNIKYNHIEADSRRLKGMIAGESKAHHAVRYHELIVGGPHETQAQAAAELKKPKGNRGQLVLLAEGEEYVPFGGGGTAFKHGIDDGFHGSEVPEAKRAMAMAGDVIPTEIKPV